MSIFNTYFFPSEICSEISRGFPADSKIHTFWKNEDYLKKYKHMYCQNLINYSPHLGDQMIKFLGVVLTLFLR